MYRRPGESPLLWRDPVRDVTGYGGPSVCVGWGSGVRPQNEYDRVRVEDLPQRYPQGSFDGTSGLVKERRVQSQVHCPVKGVVPWRTSVQHPGGKSLSLYSPISETDGTGVRRSNEPFEDPTCLHTRVGRITRLLLVVGLSPGLPPLLTDYGPSPYRLTSTHDRGDTGTPPAKKGRRDPRTRLDPHTDVTETVTGTHVPCDPPRGTLLTHCRGTPGGLCLVCSG